MSVADYKPFILVLFFHTVRARVLGVLLIINLSS